MTQKNLISVISEYRWHIGRYYSARILILMALFFETNTGFCTEIQVMSDPIFGMRYNVKEVLFDTASQDLRNFCPKLSQSRPKLWIFAQSDQQGSSYFLVSGLIRHIPDAPGKKFISTALEVDEIGVVVELKGRECRFSSADSVMAGDFSITSKVDKPLRINMAVIEDLYTDLFQRYIRAFHGRDQLLLALKKNKITMNTLNPIAQNTLKKNMPEYVERP